MYTKSPGLNGVSIIGMGAYIPEEIRTNDFWPKKLVEQWGTKNFVTLQNDQEEKDSYIHPYLIEELAKIKTDPFAGMKERRVSHIAPSEMELHACQEAIKDADLKPAAIDLLICFSLPPDRVYPPNVYKLHHKLGLNKNTLCFEMNAVCNTFLMMVDFAMQAIISGRVRKALLCISNKYSSIMDYSTSLSVVAGDGAVAVVLEKCEPDKGLHMFYHGFETSFYDSMIVRRRAPKVIEVPRSDFDESQSPEKFFFTVNEPLRAKEIITKIPIWGEEFRDIIYTKGNYKPADVSLLVTNAAMIWYSPVLAKIFGIPKEKVEDNIEKFSNMGAANLPMNIYTAYKKGRIKIDDLLLLFGHGGGASYGGAMLRWYKP